MISGTMLTLHTSTVDQAIVARDLSAATLPSEVLWVDLLNGSIDEVAFVEQATGRHVPTFEELVESESSSRLRTRNGALYLSASIVFYAGSGHPLITPVSFVLTPID
jgi:magnesium transporter